MAAAEEELDFDVDLMRDVALALEAEQRSPPEPVFLEVTEMAAQLGALHADVVQALDGLRALSLIEGPGPYSDSWLFRRITAKGRVFISEIRDPRRWREIKRAYGEILPPFES